MSNNYFSERGFKGSSNSCVKKLNDRYHIRPEKLVDDALKSIVIDIMGRAIIYQINYLPLLSNAVIIQFTKLILLYVLCIPRLSLQTITYAKIFLGVKVPGEAIQSL